VLLRPELESRTKKQKKQQKTIAMLPLLMDRSINRSMYSIVFTINQSLGMTSLADRRSHPTFRKWILFWTVQTCPPVVTSRRSGPGREETMYSTVCYGKSSQFVHSFFYYCSGKTKGCTAQECRDAITIYLYHDA
jgi:hypothetical protein